MKLLTQGQIRQRGNYSQPITPANIFLGMGDATTTWRTREASNFGSWRAPDQRYRPVPWKSAAWWNGSAPESNHFAHVSISDCSKLAYTPTDRHGREDRQLRCKPGKYLRKFFGDILTGDQIQYWAMQFAADNEKIACEFAETADEIERIYKEGPNSCMDGAHTFDSHVHPARAYAAGDLRVAYITVRGEITARSVVYPKNLVFSTIYGDEVRLAAALKSAGYRDGEESEFAGAKLLAIKQDGSYVAPYCDACDSATLTDGFLVLSVYGNINLHKTNGLAGGTECENCSDTVPDDGITSVQDRVWCQSCADTDAFYCECCEDLHPNDSYNDLNGVAHCDSCYSEKSTECAKCYDRVAHEDATLVDGDYVCDSCAEDASHCEHCSEMSFGETVDIETGRYGQVWCKSCAESDASKCKVCENTYPDDDMSDDDAAMCETCAEKQEEEGTLEKPDNCTFIARNLPLSDTPNPLQGSLLAKGVADR